MFRSIRNAATTFALIAIAFALASSPAFSDPQTQAQVASLSLSNRTSYDANIVFRTRTGLNEPKLALKPGQLSSVLFEGTYQLGGTVKVGNTTFNIDPREITLDKRNAKLWYVERNSAGAFYFR